MAQHPAGLSGKAIGMWYAERMKRRRAVYLAINLAINCNEIEIADGM